MNIKKYFFLKNYKNYFQNLYLTIFFRLGLTVKKSIIIDNDKLIFKTKSKKEFFLRTEIAYESEKTTMEWIRDFIQPNDIVFDIGANVGSYSLLIGKKLNLGSGKVYSFEPDFQNFYSLNFNIINNNLVGRVIPIALPIDDKLNFNCFLLSSLESGSAEHVLNKKIDFLNLKNPHVQGVVTLSLDDFIKLDDVPFPQHLKIDVDGSELNIIKGAKEFLNDKRLKTMIIEITPDDPETVNIIMNCGFDIYKKEIVSEELMAWNYFFVRNN